MTKGCQVWLKISEDLSFQSKCGEHVISQLVCDVYENIRPHKLSEWMFPGSHRATSTHSRYYSASNLLTLWSPRHVPANNDKNISKTTIGVLHALFFHLLNLTVSNSCCNNLALYLLFIEFASCWLLMTPGEQLVGCYAHRGLRPVLEGVCCHTVQERVRIGRALHTARVHCDKNDRSVLIMILLWFF